MPATSATREPAGGARASAGEEAGAAGAESGAAGAALLSPPRAAARADELPCASGGGDCRLSQRVRLSVHQSCVSSAGVRAPLGISDFKGRKL